MLPKLKFRVSEAREGEAFLVPTSDLVNVLEQEIPVYLMLKLPGSFTQVKVGFPTLYAIRISECGLKKYGKLMVRVHDILIAEFEDSRSVPFPRVPGNWYGMELLPWTPDLELPQNSESNFRPERGRTLNFCVSNCDDGRTGVIIRATGRTVRDAGSLEIYRFSKGDDPGFMEGWRSHPETRLMARFVPVDDGKVLIWEAETLALQVASDCR